MWCSRPSKHRHALGLRPPPSFPAVWPPPDYPPKHCRRRLPSADLFMGGGSHRMPGGNSALFPGHSGWVEKSQPFFHGRLAIRSLPFGVQFQAGCGLPPWPASLWSPPLTSPSLTLSLDLMSTPTFSPKYQPMLQPSPGSGAIALACHGLCSSLRDLFCCSCLSASHFPDGFGTANSFASSRYVQSFALSGASIPCRPYLRHWAQPSHPAMVRPKKLLLLHLAFVLQHCPHSSQCLQRHCFVPHAPP